ncbi:CD3e molecule, epsilon associated protein [Dunckerocampus dactyliophorus]|uniref:CD3e molecule, epsilon associated protein n=1 Tax=Dunckerocampus dactyliophorus TaxID=161453 RepID=UPI002404F473|nr:CD3e molecule, epsilon associated protein [Dunckerocampus dactyliophorus]
MAIVSLQKNMRRDVSPSSSEGEADKSTEELSLKQKEPEKRTSRYKCPDDFVAFRHKPCSSMLTDSLKNTNSELWLIKAPTTFNPECLQGVHVSLSGLQTLKLPSAVDGGESMGQQIYNILGSTHGTSELRLLTDDTTSSRSTVMGPAFAGLLSVSESYGGTRQPPQIIPATPVPAIPPGLKQRFHPFGSKTPTQGGESEADGTPLLEFTQVSEEEGRKRKKRKMKKEKHVNTEQEDEEVTVKQEGKADSLFLEAGLPEEKRRKKRKKVRDKEEESPPTAVVMVKQEMREGIIFQEGGAYDEKRADREEEEEALPAAAVMVKQEVGADILSQEREASEEKRRKKRKKDREAEEEESPAATVMIEHKVKSEQVDTLYDQQDDCSAKKKKKKKSKRGDD